MVNTCKHFSIPWFSLAWIVLLALAPLGAAEFYVATNGSDLSPGTKDTPFATMARARDAVRQLRGGGQAIDGVAYLDDLNLASTP